MIPAPIREQLYLPNGEISRAWSRFFQKVEVDITDLDTEVAAIQTNVTVIQQDITNLTTTTTDITNNYTTVVNSVEDVGLYAAMQPTENPTFEGRITALENELGEAMVQLETVITKLSESQRLMEDMFLQMMITNKLLHFTADAQSQFLGVPMKFDKLDNLEELI